MKTHKDKVHRASWLHFGVMERCSLSYQRNNPSYSGVTCSDNFKSEKYFVSWCIEQKGFDCFDERGGVFHLDKDLLSPQGVKIYSEDTCVFLPVELNGFLQSRYPSESGLPRGVSFIKLENKFLATINQSSVTTRLGYFDTKEEAYSAYKTAKEKVIRELADKWESKISVHAYQALVSFDISRLIKPQITKQIEQPVIPDGDDESLLACYGNRAEIDEEYLHDLQYKPTRSPAILKQQDPCDLIDDPF